MQIPRSLMTRRREGFGFRGWSRLAFPASRFPGACRNGIRAEKAALAGVYCVDARSGMHGIRSIALSRERPRSIRVIGMSKKKRGEKEGRIVYWPEKQRETKARADARAVKLD